MKDLIVCFGAILICSIFCSPIHAQRLITLERQVIIYPTQFNLVYTATLPQTVMGRQEVHHIEFSKHLSRTFMEEGIRYAEFSIRENQETDTIRITSLLTLHDYDLAHAEPVDPALYARHSFKQYLRREDNLQINNRRIKAIADSLPGETTMEYIESVFDFVTEHLDYRIYRRQDRGAARAVRTEQGDCTEYSELMATLCRAKGIPARLAYGLVTRTGYSNPHHNWVDVFIPEFGWVPFDPTHADCKDCPTTFENMENKYVYYAFKREPYAGLRGTLTSSQYLAMQRRGKDPTAPQIRFYYKVTDHTDKFLDEARAAYKIGDHKTAIEFIDTLINNGYPSFECINLKANVLLDSNEPQNCLQELQLAEFYTSTPAEKSELMYSFARYFAAIGQPDQALDYLEQAHDAGYYTAQLTLDSVFYGLRNDARWHSILKDQIVLLRGKGSADHIVDIPGSLLKSPACRDDLLESASVIGIHDMSDLAAQHRIRDMTVAVDGNTIQTYAFDRKGRLTQRTFSKDNVLTRSYSDSGLMTSTTRKSLSPEYTDSVCTQLRYDTAGFLEEIYIDKLKQDEHITETWDVTYDSATSTMAIFKRNEAGIVKEECFYSYDDSCRLTRFSSAAGQDTFSITYTYHDRKREKWLHIADTSLLVFSNQYDADGKLDSATNISATGLAKGGRLPMKYTLSTSTSKYYYNPQGHLERVEGQIQGQDDDVSNYTQTTDYDNDGLPKRVTQTFEDGPRLVYRYGYSFYD